MSLHQRKSQSDAVRSHRIAVLCGSELAELCVDDLNDVLTEMEVLILIGRIGYCSRTNGFVAITDCNRPLVSVSLDLRSYPSYSPPNPAYTSQGRADAGKHN